MSAKLMPLALTLIRSSPCLRLQIGRLAQLQVFAAAGGDDPDLLHGACSASGRLRAAMTDFNQFISIGRASSHRERLELADSAGCGKELRTILSGHPSLDRSIGSQKRIEFPKGSITPVSSVFQGVVSNPGRI
jgi:hypothetical protein